jgi:hypothetical protein
MLMLMHSSMLVCYIQCGPVALAGSAALWVDLRT